MDARLAKHPAADRHDQARALGERDELVGQQKPELGMLPAEQRLVAGDGAVRERHDRLVMHA